MNLDIDLKVKTVELNNQLREGKEPAAGHQGKGEGHQEEEQKKDELKFLEDFLDEEKIRRLIYRAFTFVLTRDSRLPEKKARHILKTLWGHIEQNSFLELMQYLDKTVDGLWEKKRITRESYSILCSFKKIRQKIGMDAGPAGADVSDELLELDELIHGKKIDTLS